MDGWACPAESLNVAADGCEQAGKDGSRFWLRLHLVCPENNESAEVEALVAVLPGRQIEVRRRRLRGHTFARLPVLSSDGVQGSCMGMQGRHGACFQPSACQRSIPPSHRLTLVPQTGSTLPNWLTLAPRTGSHLLPKLVHTGLHQVDMPRVVLAGVEQPPLLLVDPGSGGECSSVACRCAAACRLGCYA